VNRISVLFDLAGKSVNVSVSIGVALRADDSTGPKTSIAEADAVMTKRKEPERARAVRSRSAVLTI